MLRVLHLPTDTGGNAWHLSRGERELQFESDVLVSQDSWLNYPADIALHATGGASLSKLARLAAAFMQYRSRYDVFHFNFGASLLDFPRFGLRQLELPFYPRAAKLFVTYNGCDIRQKDRTIGIKPVAACHDRECYGGQCNDGTLDQIRRDGLLRMKEHVHHIWALNPDLMNFLPEEMASFLPYAIAVSDTPVLPILQRPKLRIAHAPTNRAAKGTAHLLLALERLRISHGECYELLLVEGIPHEQALEIYRSADLVVDQLLIGWYGGFAVETMLMGKPVIARIEALDLRFVPKEMVHDLSESVINAGPEDIYEILCWCVENPGALRERAQASRDYASKWHSPKFVASITTSAYEAA